METLIQGNIFRMALRILCNMTSCVLFLIMFEGKKKREAYEFRESLFIVAVI